MKPTEFRPVTCPAPCAICGKSDWCRRSDDGCHECHRPPDTVPPGFKRVKITSSGFGLYRNDNGMLQSPRTTGSTINKKPKALYDTQAEAINAITRGKEFPQGNRQTSCSTYHDAVGVVRFKVVRFDFENGDKTFRPVHPVGRRWAVGDPPGKLPMYRLPEVLEAEQLGKTIFVAEGEGCADALWSIGLAATTSAHGCKSAANTDWTPLAGADVVVLPDNDSPGETYAEKVAVILTKLDPPANVRIVPLPGVSDGDDIIQYIEHFDSRDDADIARGIEDLAEAAEPWTPPSHAERTTEPVLDPPKPWVPFPVETIPEPVRTFIIKASTAIGVDPSFVALPALATLAAAIGTTRRIELKRSWKEPSVIWAGIVGDSGTVKSPAVEIGTDALRVAQHDARVRHSEAIKQYDLDLEAHSAGLAEWKKRKKDGATDEDNPKPTEPIPPVVHRYVVEDVTIEALALLLRDNPRGLLRIQDELSGWFKSFDCYRSGRGADREHWIKIFGARPLDMDRKTGDHRSIYVPRAAASVIGGIQPGILRRALDRQNFESGLAARLLMVMPPRRKKVWTDDDLDDVEKDRFASIVRTLLSLKHNVARDGTPYPVDLRLSPEGKRAWVSYFGRHADRQLDETDTDLIAAFSKLEGYTARFTLIFHFVRRAADDPTLKNPDIVDDLSVNAGAELADWFCSETERIYQVLRETTVQEHRRRMIEFIEMRGGEITQRELVRSNARYGPTRNAEELLDALVKSGLGTWEMPAPGPEGGRPSKVFRLITRIVESVDKTPGPPKKNFDTAA